MGKKRKELSIDGKVNQAGAEQVIGRMSEALDATRMINAGQYAPFIRFNISRRIELAIKQIENIMKTYNE